MCEKYERYVSLPYVLERESGFLKEELRLISLNDDDCPVVWSFSTTRQITHVFVDLVYKKVMLVYDDYQVECGSFEDGKLEKLGKLPLRKRIFHIIGLPNSQVVWASDAIETRRIYREPGGQKWQMSDALYSLSASAGRFAVAHGDHLVTSDIHTGCGVLTGTRLQRKTKDRVDSFGCHSLPIPCWHSAVLAENNETQYLVTSIGGDIGKFTVGSKRIMDSLAVVSKCYACLLLCYPGGRESYCSTMVAFFTISGNPILGRNRRHLSLSGAHRR